MPPACLPRPGVSCCTGGGTGAGAEIRVGRGGRAAAYWRQRQGAQGRGSCHHVSGALHGAGGAQLAVDCTASGPQPAKEARQGPPPHRQRPPPHRQRPAPARCHHSVQEDERCFRRTVFTPARWVRHRSASRYLRHLTGIYRSRTFRALAPSLVGAGQQCPGRPWAWLYGSKGGYVDRLWLRTQGLSKACWHCVLSPPPPPPHTRAVPHHHH